MYSFEVLKKIKNRNHSGFSLIEVMTVIVVLGIVLGLLFAYQEQGWKLFYQSYGRGLSQVKAKLAIRLITNELREANKSRIAVGSGTSYGVPTPDDAIINSPYIYFTKPIIYGGTGDITGYDYFLYYFAKPKTKIDPYTPIKNEPLKYSVLKSIKFLNQSKIYTEDPEKIWPFPPPLIEIQKSRLPEDETFISTIMQEIPLTETSEEPQGNIEETQKSEKEEEQFLDHFERLKKETRNIPIGGNFLAQALTDPFSKEEVSIYFGSDFKNEQIVKIKVHIEEPPLWFGLMAAVNEFEVKVAPRN